MNLKIEELTKQVEAHNNLIKRTYDLEKLAVQYDAIIKGLEKRLEKVEK
jgi:hypothetical protein